MNFEGMADDTIIVWVYGGKRVPMFFKGLVKAGDPQRDPNRMEGPIGSVKACPVSLGPAHAYTGVFMQSDFSELT